MALDALNLFYLRRFAFCQEDIIDSAIINSTCGTSQCLPFQDPHNVDVESRDTFEGHLADIPIPVP